MYPAGVAGPRKVFAGTFNDKKDHNRNMDTTDQENTEPGLSRFEKRNPLDYLDFITISI